MQSDAILIDDLVDLLYADLQMNFDSKMKWVNTEQLQSLHSLPVKDHLVDLLDVDHQSEVSSVGPQAPFGHPYHSISDIQKAKTEKCTQRKVSWGILFADSVLWLSAGALAALAAMAPSGDTFLGEIFVIATLGS